MKRTPYLILVALAFSSLAIGQTRVETSDKPFIELSGKAEQDIVPDEIFINITLRERYVNKEKQSIEAQEEKLKSALKEINVPVNDLSLADANADYVKVRFRTKDVITRKDYLLKVASATALGQVFQQLDKIDITDAYVARVNHTRMDSLRREVRIRAIKAAKEKADYLLAAIGEQTGKPVIIREEESPRTLIQQTPGVYQQRVSGEGKLFSSDSYKEPEVQFQKIHLECSIYAKFTIK